VILVAGAGCAERPQEEKRMPVTQPAAASEHDIPGSGPLHGHWEYVLCFGDEADPMNTHVVLRERGKEAPRLAHVFVTERMVYRKELDLKFFIYAADPEKLVYSEEPGEKKHELRRVRREGELKVPAAFLAAFVGESAGLPLLYDARTGFAERQVSVPGNEDRLDAARAGDVLESSGMPFHEEDLPGGDRVIYWKSPRTSRGKPRSNDTIPPILIVKAPSEILRGESINVESGQLPLMDLLRLISGLTGLPVYSHIDQSSVEKRGLRLLSGLNDVNPSIVMALLEVNGLPLVETSLPGEASALVLSERAEE
jgi:hypothetical protein